MKVIFTEDAIKALDKLPKQVSERITRYMKAVSTLENPRCRGKILTGNFNGLWRYRVGDYRIICEIQDDELIILVVDIGHRKEIYN